MRYEYVILLEPDVDCEGGGRAIVAGTDVSLAGDYEQNKATLDRLMESMEVTYP
jgi:hypothetical protein